MQQALLGVHAISCALLVSLQHRIAPASIHPVPAPNSLRTHMPIRLLENDDMRTSNPPLEKQTIAVQPRLHEAISQLFGSLLRLVNHTREDFFFLLAVAWPRDRLLPSTLYPRVLSAAPSNTKLPVALLCFSLPAAAPLGRFPRGVLTLSTAYLPVGRPAVPHARLRALVCMSLPVEDRTVPLQQAPTMWFDVARIIALDLHMLSLSMLLEASRTVRLCLSRLACMHQLARWTRKSA